MCGICGIFYFDKKKKVDPELVKRMSDAIFHRGPDEGGYYVNENIGLGHRRLSIIDISTGQQPMFNHDKSVAIVFNGEIYNHHDLRKNLIDKGHKFQTKSDTESIIYQYIQSGEAVPEYLRGMFAFAIWDEKKQSLLIARDRVGKKPLYYAPVDGGIIFASELKALLHYPGIQREVNPEAIHDFLTYQYVPPPATIFRGIYKLPAAHILVCKDNKISTKKYWDLNYEPKLDISEKEAGEKLLALLDESVKIRLESEVPLGVLLSGGIDSSTVVALMRKHIPGDLKTFSIGFSEASHNELPAARLVAQKYETHHEEMIVTPGEFGTIPKIVYHFDEPFADSSALPTYHVAEMARKFVTVVLNGDGGDESFVGYMRYIGLPILRKYERIPKLLRYMSRPFFNAFSSTFKANTFLGNLNYINEVSLYDPDLRYFQMMLIFREDLKWNLYSSDFRAQLPNKKSSDWALKYYNDTKLKESPDRMMYSDIKTYLAEDLLPKVDRTSMAVALEGRSPFLDHHLMEFAAKLPESIKFPNGQLKGFLKKTIAHLLPPPLLEKPKQGFGVPVGDWFRDRWQQKIKDILLDKTATGRNVFNPKSVERIINEHTTRRTNHSHRIWALLMLELWFRTFSDQPNPPKGPISI